MQIAAQSERGYTLTLTLFLSEVPVEHSGNFARRVASLRSLVQGIPLRKHFANLACGKSKKGNTEVFLCRKNRPIYIKPMVGSGFGPAKMNLKRVHNGIDDGMDGRKTVTAKAERISLPFPFFPFLCRRIR